MVLIINLFFCILSCGIYSFTGASISSDTKTISVDFFPNYSKQIQPSLSQFFTESLKDVFIAQTTLNLESSSGDLRLSGFIKSYEIKPISIATNETTQNRLTIIVNVTFINTKDASQNFEEDFSRFADFDSNLTLSNIEDELINQIVGELSQDIFNKSVVNW